MRSHIRTEVLGSMRDAVGSVRAIAYFFASPRVEISLITSLVAVVFVAVVLHGTLGRPYSQWFVYETNWFLTSQALLAASLVCALYVRWPWKRHQAGSNIVRGGLLIALAGSFVNSWSGIEGPIFLREGESTDHFAAVGQFQITASWADRPQEPPYVFMFESGPADWNGSTALDIGAIDGMSARVLNYYQQGRVIETWCADERGVGGPLVRFELEGNGDGKVGHVLTDQDFGAEVFVGPIALRLQRATSKAMLADFLQPLNRELSGQGYLTMYYEDDVQQIAVDEHVGKTIEVGNSGVSVELVHYLPDAKLDRAGKFQAQSAEPRNPLVELLVHVPNEKKPFRQVAFAKSPLLNLDGVYERVCPVKFVYQHPKIKPTSAIEFLQDDDNLYCRSTDGREFQSHGEVTTGSRLKVPGGFTLLVSEYLPHARRQISFKSAEKDEGDSEALAPAAEVEIAVGGITERRWFQRNHPEFQRQSIATPDGELHVQFGDVQVPLGFSLRLLDCYSSHDRNATGASTVQLVDADLKADAQKEINTRQPLEHNGVVFYQSAVREAGHGKQASVFRVVYNPGRPLKTVGGWSFSLGILAMFAIRAYWSIGLRRQWHQTGF
jgi:hypothetical protein